VAQQVQKVLELFHLQNRVVRPSDSLSARSEEDQQRVRKLVEEYRKLPEDLRRQRPDLLNEVGKLEVAAGELEAAQQDFQAAAGTATDPKVKADAQYNAHQAALQRQKWDEALAAIREAAGLEPERFRPFPLEQYEPQRILGAGGFGVV